MCTTERTTRRSFLGGSLAAVAGGLVASRVDAADAPAKERPWQIGCYTRPWDRFDYRTALDAIAEAGFEHAGLMTTKAPRRLVISAATTPEEAQAVAAELKKRALSVPSVYGGGIPVGKSLQAGIQALRTLIDRCAVVGSASLMMGGMGNPKLYDAYYKAIAECCGYAADKKMELVLKPHGGLNATGPQCRKCIESVGHKNFRLWYDPGNILFYSQGKLDPVKDAATVDGLVTGMCIKDYKHPRNVMLTPGTGQVDFAGVLARLKAGGFTRGPLVVETLARGDAKATLAEAKKARKFLEDLTGQKA